MSFTLVLYWQHWCFGGDHVCWKAARGRWTPRWSEWHGGDGGPMDGATQVWVLGVDLGHSNVSHKMGRWFWGLWRFGNQVSNTSITFATLSPTGKELLKKWILQIPTADQLF